MDVETTDFGARALRLDDGLIAPYGGALLQTFVPAQDRQTLAERVTVMPRLQVSAADLFDMELIASGALSPLTGFMTGAAYASVLASATLPDGRPWGLPVTLAIPETAGRSIRVGQEVALYYGEDLVAIMRADDIFPWDPQVEARALGGPVDAHSRIRARQARHVPYLLGGPIALLAARGAEFMQRHHLWPEPSRRPAQRGSRRACGARVARRKATGCDPRAPPAHAAYLDRGVEPARAGRGGLGILDREVLRC